MPLVISQDICRTLDGFHSFGEKSATELMSQKAALVLHSFFDKCKSKALFCRDKKIRCTLVVFAMRVHFILKEG